MRPELLGVVLPPTSNNDAVACAPATPRAEITVPTTESGHTILFVLYSLYSELNPHCFLSVAAPADQMFFHPEPWCHIFISCWQTKMTSKRKHLIEPKILAYSSWCRIAFGALPFSLIPWFSFPASGIMKQDVLPAGMFVKNPSKKFAVKHNKLLERVRPTKVQKKYKMSSWRKKELAERERLANEREEGAKAWREWLERKQFTNKNIDPMTMFLVHGPAPPPEAPNGETFTESELDSSPESDEDDERDWCGDDDTASSCCTDCDDDEETKEDDARIVN